MRFSKLPAHKTLEQFDFDAQPGLDRRMVEDLATLRFIEEQANCLRDQRRQPPHGRPPRRHRSAPPRDHRWGKTVITPEELSRSLTGTMPA
jgi:hypothetical protein